MTDLTGLNPADRHRAAAATFAEVAGAITDWDAQTPVPEWKARDVVAHLVEWLPGFLQSNGVRLDGAPADAAAPAEAFAQLTAAVQALLDAPDAHRVIATSMFGDKPLDEMVDQFYTADVFMHTWDLARSGGIDPALDPAFASELVSGLEAMGPMLQESGQFGTPVPVPEDADPVTSLVGFIGRDPGFRP
ncbi:maleylpyruvate isomerase family mycothiol-dependent enzyme [Tsukamurella sp. 1534]|uniref:maleylpyruvate isomerase family mycothiol-dependent enzyme n=1 Tax=Tsukamurella sp. 1534 TaxID=1151061 RepID=UPI0003153B24|nr:maleylpyruvate isomerase family mycothiol-dependent enzyme [Tsukamurella sp. 1534]